MIELTSLHNNSKIWLNPRNIIAVTAENSITTIWTAEDKDSFWRVEESVETVINRINLYFLTEKGGKK